MSLIKPSRQSFTVRVLRYGGTEHRRWSAKLSRRDGPLLVLDAEFDCEVRHEHLGYIPVGTRTIEYYWQDQWYNVFQFFRENGETRLWYCNINTPPIIEDSSITYIDLDLDVLVKPDLSYQILDSEEFEHHARIFEYPREVQESAHQTLAELMLRIENRQFPFNQ